LPTRRDLLHEFVPVEARLPSIITADAVEAELFMSEAVRLGHEGVIVKGVGRNGHVVYVEPVQVVALRFARVKGYRHDKLAAVADQIAAVQALLR
jgi:ATP-dependent DNA ligase